MPALNKLVNFAAAREFLLFPVSGAGSNVPAGTPLMPGATAGTNKGVLIPITAASNARVIGLLEALHSNTIQGDATTATLVQWFPIEGAGAGSQSLLGSPAIYPNPYPTDRVAVLDTFLVAQMDYAITAGLTGQAATSMTVTSAGSSTVINNGSWQTAYDSAWVYFSAGTAIGELGFIKSSIASTSATLTSALTVNFAAADTMILINPLFYETPTWLVNSTTVPTLIDSNVAAGTGRAVQLASWINRNGFFNRLDPKIFHKTQNLQLLNLLGFTSFLAFQNTAYHPNG